MAPGSEGDAGVHGQNKAAAIAAAVAAAVLVAAGYLGIGQALGAHPFWAIKVVWIGVGIGAVLFGLSRFWTTSGLVKLSIALVLLAGSAGVTMLGKARFAASYAEDFVAGRMWFLGWMALVAATFLVLALLLARRG